MRSIIFRGIFPDTARQYCLWRQGFSHSRRANDFTTIHSGIPTQLLQVKSGEKILEIGTGSIFQASVLAEMGAKVFTIERQKLLFEKTKNFVLKGKYQPLNSFTATGLKDYQHLLHSIRWSSLLQRFYSAKINWADETRGKMVIPVDEGEHQRMLRITRNPDNSLTEEAFENFSFVPMLAGKSRWVKVEGWRLKVEGWRLKVEGWRLKNFSCAASS